MLHTYWCAVVFFKFHNISLKWCLNDGCSRQKLLFLGGIILKWAKQVKRQNTRQITTNIFAVQSEHIQEALSFFHLPHCQSERAPYKTPTCLSITTLGRWAGARQKRTRASESEGGWIRRGEPMWEWLKKKTKINHKDEMLERAEHVESSPSVDPLLKRDEWMGSGTPQRIQKERVTNQQCDSLLKI